jgi:hypothetical protein
MPFAVMLSILRRPVIRLPVLQHFFRRPERVALVVLRALGYPEFLLALPCIVLGRELLRPDLSHLRPPRLLAPVVTDPAPQTPRVADIQQFGVAAKLINVPRLHFRPPYDR